MNRVGHDELDELFRVERGVRDNVPLEGIRSNIAGDLKPVRQIPSAAVFATSFLVFAVAIAVASSLALPSYGWELMMPAARASVFLTIAASAAMLAFSLSLQMTPGSRSYWPPALMVMGLSALTLVALAAVFQVKAEPRFLKSGLICARAGMPFAVPAAILFVVLLKRGAVLSFRRAGMLAGMLAGLVSMAVLEIHCPNFDLLHVVTWHFGIVLGGALAGYALGWVAKGVSRLVFDAGDRR
jgi:hypothetical protein